jgi:hypothetical protein
MGFNAAHVVGQQSERIDNPLYSSQLSAKEIEVMLSIVKRTTFLGEDIEPLYNLVVKLQNQYTEITK